MPTETIKYHRNNPKYGIKIDWDLVRKHFKKLKVPKETYYPLKADLDKVGYVIDLSDRSRGKTTNKLLVALILYRLYGIQLQYVRQSRHEVEKRMLQDLYDVVIQNDYIEKIFDGEWNHIFYRGKRWYLCHVDESGEIDRKDLEHCTFCVGLDENDKLKSTYNAPTGDMIFYDEFISTTYGYNDFIRFCDICKTIIRERVSPVIFMSANNINLDSDWWTEFGIQKDVQTLHQGDFKYIETEFGTHIYIELLEPDISAHRQHVNTRFWGFNNTRLISITGRGDWATESFQHIPEDDEVNTQFNRLFLYHADKYLKLKLVTHPKFGLCVYVTPATRTYDDSLILTCEDLTDPRYIFGYGEHTPLCKLLWQLYAQNKFFYARNADGALLRTYIGYVNTYQRHRNA